MCIRLWPNLHAQFSSVLLAAYCVAIRCTRDLTFLENVLLLKVPCRRWQRWRPCHARAVLFWTNIVVLAKYNSGLPLPSVGFSVRVYSLRNLVPKMYELPPCQFSEGPQWVASPYVQRRPSSLWPHWLYPAESFQCGLCMAGLHVATRLLVLSGSTFVGLWLNTAASFPLARRYTLHLHHPLVSCCYHPPRRGRTGYYLYLS